MILFIEATELKFHKLRHLKKHVHMHYAICNRRKYLTLHQPLAIALAISPNTLAVYTINNTSAIYTILNTSH